MDCSPKTKALVAEGFRVNVTLCLLRRCLGGVGLRGFGLAGVALGILAAEALDASRGVHQLLLAGKERMAVGADLNADVALVRGTGRKVVATRAVDLYLIVCGVNSSFHNGWNLSVEKAILPDRAGIGQTRR